MFSNHYKTPRTRQEMAASVDVEYSWLVRSKRSGRNLPDAWDDVPRSRQPRDKGSRRKDHRK